LGFGCGVVGAGAGAFAPGVTSFIPELRISLAATNAAVLASSGLAAGSTASARRCAILEDGAVIISLGHRIRCP